MPNIALELANRSKIKPEGVLDDEIVYLEYLVDLFILQPISTSKGHLMILGRPWLAIANTFIGCQSKNMFISQGYSIKQITLYPHAKCIMEIQNILWYYDEASNRERMQPIFSIDQGTLNNHQNMGILVLSFIILTSYLNLI